MTITVEHVRRLLAAEDPTSRLVVMNGNAEVVSAEDLRAARYAGAVVVADRAHLVETADIDPDDPSETELRALAERLDTEITLLGG